MKELNIENAKKYALKKFNELPELKRDWNIIHAEGIIESLKLLNCEDKIKEKLFAIAWVHDIGKIKSNDGHAKLSLEILKKEFELDQIETDCILNHGSSSVPKTEEGKIFRYSDGLSLFTSKAVMFKYYAEAKEGSDFNEITSGIKKSYDKYREKYSDSETALRLLDRLYNNLNF